MAANLNAPHLEADHPINRVTPKTHCSKHPTVPMTGLKFGKSGKLKDKVHHSCPLTGCDVMYVYTPRPVGNEAPLVPPAPAAHPALPAAYGLHPGVAVGQPLPFPPFFAPPGLPIPPGLHPPMGPGPAAPVAAQANVPVVAAAGTVPCASGCRTAGDRKLKNANTACRNQRCKGCCGRYLDGLERAGQAHGGCGVQSHSRPAFRPVAAAAAAAAQPNVNPPAPPQQATPPRDAPPAPAADLLAMNGDAPPAPAPAAVVPRTAAVEQGGLVRPVALGWQSVQQSQSLVAQALRRSKYNNVRVHEINVVVWYSDNVGPRRFKVNIVEGSRFSLAVDGGDFLIDYGIHDDVFDHFDGSDWVRMKSKLLLAVPDSKYFLFRTKDVSVCRDFADEVQRLKPARATGSTPAAPSRKRLGEAPVSPLKQPAKKVCIQSPPRSSSSATPHRRTRSSTSQVSLTSSKVIEGALAPFPLAKSGPTRDISPDVVNNDQAAGNDVVPDSDDEGWLAQPIKVYDRNSAFPGDFAVSDVIRGLKRSKLLAAERKLSRSSGPHRRMDILSQLLGVTIKSSTASNITNELNKAKANFPAIYARFKMLGHADSATVAKLRIAVRKADDSVAGASHSGTLIPMSVDSPLSSPLSPSSSLSSPNALTAPSDNAKAPPVRYRWSHLKLDYDFYKALPARIARYHDVLKEIAEDPLAHDHCVDLQAAVRAVRQKTATPEQAQMVERMNHLNATYYNTEGYRIVHIQTRAFLLPSFYPQASLDAIRPLTILQFHDNVIIREVLLLLIQEDLNVEEDEALDIYEESCRVVQLIDSDDERDASDADSDAPLVPRTVSDQLMAALAAERRRELEAEDRDDQLVVKAEPQEISLPQDDWSVTEVKEDGKTVLIIE